MIASGLRWMLYLGAAVLVLVALFFLTIVGVVVNHDLLAGHSNPRIGSPQLNVDLVEQAKP